MSLLVDIQKQLGDFTLNVLLESDGGIVGLLGASGCGKSMTLKCIAGIEKPGSGHIELDGTVLFDAGAGNIQSLSAGAASRLSVSELLRCFPI